MKAPKLSITNFHTVPSSFLSLTTAAWLMVGELLLGLAGFIVLEGYTLSEAFYMTIITISTVGYAEIRPLSEDGRLFTSFLIIINIGIFAYLLAVFSYYVVQGEIFKKMHINLINNSIDKLSDHVIICGYGKYGKESAAQLENHQLPFVVMDKNPEEIEQIQKSQAKLLYVEGDATQDEDLLKAGIKRARAIIASLPDDSDNVFIVLSARQLNPSINIISRAKNPKSVKKLQMAGADHVVMPEQIGGFYMATLVSKPGAVEFFSFITNEYESDINFEEISYDDLPEECRGLSIRDLSIRKYTGANIIGYRSPDGRYLVNPVPEVRLQPGAGFILLGSKEQLTRLKDYLENYSEYERREAE